MASVSGKPQTRISAEPSINNLHTPMATIYMKYSHHTLLLIAATYLLMLAACSDIDEHEALQDQGFAVAIEADITQQSVTRANDSGFADGDQIGVFISDLADNECFTYDAKSRKWASERPLYWKDNVTPTDVYGYYPYDAKLSSVEAYPFTVSTSQNDAADYERSDFLWAKAEGVIPTKNPITLMHRHIMAGIRVSLVRGMGIEEEEWKDLQQQVTVANTVVGAIVNINTGEVRISGNATETVALMKAGGDWRGILVPQTIKANTPLLFVRLNGTDYTFLREEETVLLSGRMHQFTIMVNKQLPVGDYELELADEAILPWEDDGLTHSDGTAREYIVVDIKENEYLSTVLKNKQLDPEKIVNLKLRGTMHARPNYSEKENAANFKFIREMMPNLEAINMKELRIVDADTRHPAWNREPVNNAIPWRAFCDMHNLRHVVLPDGLASIGDEAFMNTNLHGSLILPDGLVSIGWSAFESCQFTGELYIPPTVTSIGERAFAHCDFNCELALPESMTELGDGAFLNCRFLHGNIFIPDGLTVLEEAWLGTAITGIADVPKSVKSIQGIGCILQGIKIPEGVESVSITPILDGYGWWDWNEQQRSQWMIYDVELPSTVKSLGYYAFDGIMSPHISLPEGLEVIPRACFRNAGLQDTLHLPSTLRQIESEAFNGCTMLSAVVLPAALERIESQAFLGCTGLEYIQCLSTTPPEIADNAFGGVNQYGVPGLNKEATVVVVPEGTVEAYRQAPGWNDFKRITAYRDFVCRPMLTKVLNRGGQRTIVLNADGSWQVSQCPAWVHLDKTEGYRKTELHVTIDALPHNQASRSGSVVFELTSGTGTGITTSYEVKQYDYPYDEDQQLTLQQASRGKGINILLIGEGYDAEDISSGQYLDHMQQEMEFFFAIEPYKAYRDYFSVHVAIALSEESGIASDVFKWRNTKFNVHWNSMPGDDQQRIMADFYEIARYVVQDIAGGAITERNIDASLIVCVPNTDFYEGICQMYGSGAAIAICPHSTQPYPRDARGIIQHEAGGHGFAKLADEYIYKCCGKQGWIDERAKAEFLEGRALGFYRNLSLSGKYAGVEWRHLIFDSRYSDIVDIFEGGFEYRRGIYRSEANSCMNDNRPYFSSWSRQLIVERIMELAGEPFDYELFVANDSREMGDKFLTRSLPTGTIQHTPPFDAHHGPIIIKGSPLDYIKKGGKK